MKPYYISCAWSCSSGHVLFKPIMPSAKVWSVLIEVTDAFLFYRLKNGDKAGGWPNVEVIHYKAITK